MVEQHAASEAEKETARKATEEKRQADERELVRIHADNIEKCLTSVVEPVLAEGINQLNGMYRAALKSGRTNDPRLHSKQTIIEIDIEVEGKHRHRGGASAQYRLEYAGDVDRGTITGMEDFDGVRSTFIDSHQMAIIDVTTERIEGHLRKFVEDFLKQDSGPHPS